MKEESIIEALTWIEALAWIVVTVGVVRVLAIAIGLVA